MGVFIQDVISITTEMVPGNKKFSLQWEWHIALQNGNNLLAVPFFQSLEREKGRGCICKW